MLTKCFDRENLERFLRSHQKFADPWIRWPSWPL